MKKKKNKKDFCFGNIFELKSHQWKALTINDFNLGNKQLGGINVADRSETIGALDEKRNSINFGCLIVCTV